MITLTLELIRDNPWNAVHLMLPRKMDRILLRAALAAVAYCRASEFAFAVAATENRYKQPGWWRPSSSYLELDPMTPYGEIESRWFEASRRYIWLLAQRNDEQTAYSDRPEEAYL